MKKTTTVLILTTMFMVGMKASAQTAFGLKAGVNLTSMNFDDPEASYESRTGYHAGFFLRGKFDRIGVQPEILLFTQGGIKKEPSVADVEESFTYLSIPFIFKFYPVMGLNIQAGPQFGFLIDGERTYEVLGQLVTEDIKDSYKNSDVSISAGAGYDFKWGLNVDLRYNIGVMDINEAAAGETAKSRIFLVSVGWNFLKGDDD